VSHPDFFQISWHTILTEPRRTEAAKDVETAFFFAHLFQTRMKTVAQNIPLRQQFTMRCLKEVSRFLEVLTCVVAFDRVR
jgi:hypothetical protein